MNKMLKIFIIFISLVIVTGFCVADTKTSNNDINKAPEIKSYEIIIPPVLGLDKRASLEKDEINILDKQKFKNLLKFDRILTREINTINIRYSTAWIQRLEKIAREIRKHPDTIVILEGFRNTELTERENIEMSKKHALFVASILKDIYRVKNTMAAIGRGIEKNDELNYNCVIISLIKDVNPSDRI
ncbi:MAG: hypothetical protein J6T23_03440 [Elusimicrobia bacterium]|nr:hypothetical protein [Elusimicrobiota bacterium]